MQKKQQSILWTVLALALAVGVWYFKQKNNPPAEENKSGLAAAEKIATLPGVDLGQAPPKQNKESKSDSSGSASGSEKTTGETTEKKKPVVNSAADSMLKVARITDSKFTSLKGSRFVERKYGNDGDSFLVKHSEGETEFRLYYVDCCESWFNKRYAEKSAARLKEQGDYFGGLSQDHTVQVGIVAKKFVAKLLKEKPFTVATKWESVYRSDRMYAFVIVDYEGEKRYLHEILVAKGLARIHTKPMPLPDSTSSSRQRTHLRSMEKAAKEGKVGAWSIKK